MGIYPEQLLHREYDWFCEFHNTEMSALLENTAHLAETFVEIGKIANAKRCCYSIEGVVGKCQLHTVFLGK